MGENTDLERSTGKMAEFMAYRIISDILEAVIAKEYNVEAIGTKLIADLMEFRKEAIAELEAEVEQLKAQLSKRGLGIRQIAIENGIDLDKCSWDGQHRDTKSW